MIGQFDYCLRLLLKFFVCAMASLQIHVCKKMSLYKCDLVFRIKITYYIAYTKNGFTHKILNTFQNEKLCFFPLMSIVNFNKMIFYAASPTQIMYSEREIVQTCR